MSIAINETFTLCYELEHKYKALLFMCNTKAGFPLRDKNYRQVDNCHRAVRTNHDSTLDEYLATIASAIISKNFDIIKLAIVHFKEVPPWPFNF